MVFVRNEVEVFVKDGRHEVLAWMAAWLSKTCFCKDMSAATS